MPSTPCCALTTASASASGASVSNGAIAPVPMPESRRSCSPSLALPSLAIVSGSELPRCRSVAGISSATRMATAIAAATPRWRTMPSAQPCQKRALRSRRRMRRRSSRGPIVASTTGSSVIAASVATSGMIIPP